MKEYQTPWTRERFLKEAQGERTISDLARKLGISKQRVAILAERFGVYRRLYVRGPYKRKKMAGVA